VIPNYDDKYEAPALFDPADAVRSQGEGLPDIPPAILLGYQPALTEAVRERAGEPTTLVRSQRVYPLSEAVGYAPVHESGVGAPVTASVAENAIAAGAEVVVMLGGCAALQDVAPDAAILPTGSVRDEGVSYHYLPPDEPVEPTAPLVDALDDSLSAAGFPTPRGRTWTTSAMYRETVPEAREYRERGVVSLCMESAALWAVCRYRGVDTATVHQVGDYLDPDGWVPEADADRGLPEMLRPTRRALAAHLE
jgi:uridine phosphorylase